MKDNEIIRSLQDRRKHLIKAKTFLNNKIVRVNDSNRRSFYNLYLRTVEKELLDVNTKIFMERIA